MQSRVVRSKRNFTVHLDFFSSGLLLSLLSFDSVLKGKLAIFLTPAIFFLYIFFLLNHILTSTTERGFLTSNMTTY